MTGLHQSCKCQAALQEVALLWALQLLRLILGHACNGQGTAAECHSARSALPAWQNLAETYTFGNCVCLNKGSKDNAARLPIAAACRIMHFSSRASLRGLLLLVCMQNVLGKIYDKVWTLQRADLMHTLQLLWV